MERMNSRILDGIYVERFEDMYRFLAQLCSASRRKLFGDAFLGSYQLLHPCVVNVVCPLLSQACLRPFGHFNYRSKIP